MFDFFKKQQKPSFKGLCDFHNHLLPGIDDGSKNVEMSNKMLELYDELGFDSIIATPHVYQELYPNTPESIKTAFNELSAGRKHERGPNMEAYAAEYMVDEIFMNKLKEETPALLFRVGHNNNPYILVEINFFGDTAMLEQACFQLSQKNISSILAHPERYHLLKNISDYEALKHKGFLFQLNALSLLGHYGPEVEKKAKQLLLAGLYDFVATDAHHPRHLKMLASLTLSKKEMIEWDNIREFQLRFFEQ